MNLEEIEGSSIDVSMTELNISNVQSNNSNNNSTDDIIQETISPFIEDNPSIYQLNDSNSKEFIPSPPFNLFIPLSNSSDLIISSSSSLELL